jgi:SAM-dependent methyltransferase
MDMAQARECVARATWYHQFELLPGLITPGRARVDAAATFNAWPTPLPSDLRGIRALDIGAWDGPYSFELERRGAEVVALDIQDPERTGFQTAKQILGSRVKYVRATAYRLPDDLGTFDLILFLGVFYHLWHPMSAFQNIARSLRVGGTLYYEGAVLDYADRTDPKLFSPIRGLLPQLRDTPMCYYVKDEYCGDATNWFLPTACCVRQWVETCGLTFVGQRVDGNHNSRVSGTARKDNELSQTVEHAVM